MKIYSYIIFVIVIIINIMINIRCKYIFLQDKFRFQCLVIVYFILAVYCKHQPLKFVVEGVGNFGAEVNVSAR